MASDFQRFSVIARQTTTIELSNDGTIAEFDKSRSLAFQGGCLPKIVDIGWVISQV